MFGISWHKIFRKGYGTRIGYLMSKSRKYKPGTGAPQWTDAARWER